MTQAITLESLEVLDAIDRMGSFAAAAEVMYRVPSAISYTVQKLEQDLGVTLFVKQGRKSVLTPAGQVLLDQGRELLAASARLAETTRQVDSGWESRLTIAVDALFDTEHIYPLLKQFFSIKPDIEINLYQESLAGGWEALVDERVDLAIGLTEKPASVTGMEVVPYLHTQWQFCVSPDHPLASLPQPITQQAIAEHRMVIIRDSSQHLASLTHRLFSQQPALRVSNARDKLQAQIAGLGVGFLPADQVHQALLQGQLVAIEVEGVERCSLQHIAWRKGHRGKALRWFVDQLIG